MTTEPRSTPPLDAFPAFAARGAGDSHATKAGAPCFLLGIVPEAGEWLRNAQGYVLKNAQWLAADPGSPT
jgi:hypothetical protein